jgi:hypothetical protein
MPKDMATQNHGWTMSESGRMNGVNRYRIVSYTSIFQVN